MASPIEAQLILCDAAHADPSGKMHMLGAGWHIVSRPTPPHAIAVMLKVPWDRTNQKIMVSLRLLDDDGHDVALPSGDAPKPLKVETEVEVGRPPGIAAGSYIPAAFAVNIPPLDLSPGRYSWHLEAAEKTLDEPFQVVGSR